MSQLFTLRNYKKDSIIYFENDQANEIFILRSGKISLVYHSIYNDQTMMNYVKIGEFFGIKCAVGKTPHEETAKVEEDSSVVCIKVENFAQFVEDKPEIVVKMMKNFSGQLRKVHSTLADISKISKNNNNQKSIPLEIIHLGELFHKEKSFSHALYIYQTYQAQYPNGKNHQRVSELIDFVKDEIVFMEDDLPMIIEETE